MQSYILTAIKGCDTSQGEGPFKWVPESKRSGLGEHGFIPKLAAGDAVKVSKTGVKLGASESTREGTVPSLPLASAGQRQSSRRTQRAADLLNPDPCRSLLIRKRREDCH